MVGARLHILDEIKLLSSRCRNGTISCLPCPPPQPRPRSRRLSRNRSPRRCRWRSLTWARKRRFCENKCPKQNQTMFTLRNKSRFLSIPVASFTFKGLKRRCIWSDPVKLNHFLSMTQFCWRNSPIKPTGINVGKCENSMLLPDIKKTSQSY